VILIISKTPNIFCSFVWVWNVVFHIKQKTYAGVVENSVLGNIFVHSDGPGKTSSSNLLLGVSGGTPDLLLRLWYLFQSTLEIAELVKPRPLRVNSLFNNQTAI
jgi:hypothetical protein